jgi:galactokinase
LKEGNDCMAKTSTAQSVISPGRVNLLGEHVDYNDGLVLPIAIDLSMTLTFEPLDKDAVILNALDLGKTSAFRIEDLADKVDTNGEPLPHFALYPASVAWALKQAGYSISGMRTIYTSNIPIGAGLSSSAAVEVGFALAFMALGGWETDMMELVKLTKRGENEYVGVSSGIMDQFACLFGVKEHALYLDTRELTWEALPLPQDVAIVVADPNISRELANSAYNARQRACTEAVKNLKTFLPGISSLRDVSVEDFEKYADRLPGRIRSRARHVVEEIARVEAAVRLLKVGDIHGFGHLMVAGHASLRDLYEVSLPELDALVEIAIEQPGCYGARLTGAGFGGCTVNLVQEDKCADFILALKTGYKQQTGKEVQLYPCRAAQGAHLAAKPLNN